MKYLVYFRPNKELSDLILSQKHIVLPGSGLHSTLCFFYMGSKSEEELISELSKIEFEPFKIETLSFGEFDDSSLVLKLSRSDRLLQLHRKIVLSVRNYANPGFEAIAEKYFGDRFDPHLTISRSSSDFDRNSTELLGIRDIISEYHLARKINRKWNEVKTFYSS